MQIGGVDLGDIIKQKSKELLGNIDLSGIKLPKADAEVEVGTETKNLLWIGLVLLALWLFTKNN